MSEALALDGRTFPSHPPTSLLPSYPLRRDARPTMSTRPRPAAERTRDRTYSAPYPPRQSRVPGPPRRSNSSLESSSRGAPSRTTEPYPTIWMSTELKIDPFAMPSLPRLPLGLVEQVYTHKSWLGSYHNNYTKDEARSYKPLEFFGDSAIEFQVSRVLCERFPLAGPGLLTVSTVVALSLRDVLSLTRSGIECTVSPIEDRQQPHSRRPRLVLWPPRPPPRREAR